MRRIAGLGRLPRAAYETVRARLGLLVAAIVEWFLLLSVLAGCLAFLLRHAVAYPTPILMRSMAAVGVALVLSFVIEASWMTVRLARVSDEEHERWLGQTTGFGLAGLVSLAIALLVAEHRAAGHENLLDGFGVWWTAIALGSLGVLVVLQPVITDRWVRAANLTTESNAD